MSTENESEIFVHTPKLSCIGKIVIEINQIAKSYNIVKSILGHYCLELKELLNDTNKDEDIQENYHAIVKNMRTQINKFIDSDPKTNNNINCLSPNEQTLMFETSRSNKSVQITLIPFVTMKYLIEINKQKEFLFYKYSPEKVKYAINEKVTFNNIPDESLLYPVWFFYVDNKLDQDYSIMLEALGSDKTYTDLLNERTLFKSEMIMNNRKTLDALGKYKFSYKTDENELYLSDPEKPEQTISAKRQGVENGYYSFEDSVDQYNTREQINLAIGNTIMVIEKLIYTLGLFIDEIIQIRDTIRR